MIKNKNGDAYQTVLWIAFISLLALALLYGMYKAGIFQSQTMTSLKEKFLPFS